MRWLLETSKKTQASKNLIGRVFFHMRFPIAPCKARLEVNQNLQCVQSKAQTTPIIGSSQKKFLGFGLAGF